MKPKDKKLAHQIYLYLAALFMTSLVVSNLIFPKFFFWQPFGEIQIFGATLFEISVGILPYPITFLITDLISEIFGKQKANQVVTAGIFASFFSILIILVANAVPASTDSAIDDAMFSKVFGLSPLGVLASMLAYLSAQYIDVSLYHYWKKLTKGRKLWLRNNFSTFSSQFVDSFSVVSLLCIFGVFPWTKFWGLVVSGFLFKLLIAFLDTPFLYLFVYLVRKRFGLKVGQEIILDN